MEALKLVHDKLTLLTSGPLPPELRRFFPQPRRIPSQIEAAAPPSAHAFTTRLALQGLAGVLPPGCHGPVTIRDAAERTLYEGACDKGLLHGAVRTSTPEGALIEERLYHEGKRHGATTTWDAEGKLISRTHYEHSLEHGQTTSWHPSGRVALRGHHAQGRRHGLWRTWSPSGRLQTTGAYHRGHPIGRHQTWYPNGTRRGDLTFKTLAQVRACFRRHSEMMEKHLLDGHFPLIGHLTGQASGPTTGHVCARELGSRSGPWRVWYPDGKLAAQGRDGQELARFAPEARRRLPGGHWGTFEATAASGASPLPEDTTARLARRIFASLSPLSQKASACLSRSDTEGEHDGPRAMRLAVTFTGAGARPAVTFTAHSPLSPTESACLARIQQVAGHGLRLKEVLVGYTFVFDWVFASVGSVSGSGLR